MREAFIGFDSAWSGRNKGGLAWASFDGNELVECPPPQPADFDEALSQIQRIEKDHDYLLVAIDQPTIVPNQTGSRPVESVARALVGRRLHSGVQPAFRGKTKKALFGDRAPIWDFLKGLEDGRDTDRHRRQNPHAARKEQAGSFLIEVYPAVTLPAWLPSTLDREAPPKPGMATGSSGKAPVGYAARYNPGRAKTIAMDDWRMVGRAVAEHCRALGLRSLFDWTKKAIAGEARPRKTEQDKMDAVICLLIALMWRRSDGERLALLGDRESGYMATPVSEKTKEILEAGAGDSRFSCPPEQWDFDADWRTGYTGE